MKDVFRGQVFIHCSLLCRLVLFMRFLPLSLRQNQWDASPLLWTYSNSFNLLISRLIVSRYNRIWLDIAGAKRLHKFSTRSKLSMTWKNAGQLGIINLPQSSGSASLRSEQVRHGYELLGSNFFTHGNERSPWSQTVALRKEELA